MKRRTEKKQRAVARRHAFVLLRREIDKHDRAHVLAFMRGCIEELARTDIDSHEKVHVVAAIARRLAPPIMARRAVLETLTALQVSGGGT